MTNWTKKDGTTCQTLAAWVPDWLARSLEESAEELGVTRSKLITHILRVWVQGE